MRRRARQAHVLAIRRRTHGAVLVLRIDDEEVDARQQVSERHELHEVALARARHGEHGHVGVLEAGIERIDDDLRLRAGRHAVHDAALHGQRARGEWEQRDQRAGVQVAVHQQVVAALGQARPEPALLLEHGDPRVRQHAVERALDAARQVVQHAWRAGAQQHVQADGEHPLLTPLQCVAQPLGVLEGYLALRVGQPSAAHVDQPRRLQLDQLVAQQLDHTGRLERVDVETDLQGMLELDERREPAGRDAARVADHDQHARVLVLESNVIARDAGRRRRQQVGQRACAEREAALFVRQRSDRARLPTTQPQHAV